MYFGYRDKLEKEEAELHIFELELRECEADMDLSELRSDILRLSMKYEPERLAALQASQDIEDMTGGIQPTQHSTMFKKRRFSLADGYSEEKQAAKTSFGSALYPCYVLPLTHLLAMSSLPAHEDALDLELLEVLTARSKAPCSAFSFFVRFLRTGSCPPS